MSKTKLWVQSARVERTFAQIEPAVHYYYVYLGDSGVARGHRKKKKKKSYFTMLKAQAWATRGNPCECVILAMYSQKCPRHGTVQRRHDQPHLPPRYAFGTYRNPHVAETTCRAINGNRKVWNDPKHNSKL